MNALTKVFVVLHVVLSMILVAGLVVFVNRTEDFRKELAAQTNKYNVAKTALASAEADLNVVRSDAQQKINDKQTDNSRLQQLIDNDQTQIATLNKQVAELTSQNALLTGSLTSANEALKVAQKSNETLQANYTELRKGADKNQIELTESNLHVNDLQNKLDVTESARKTGAEENVQLTTDLAAARAMIDKAGLVKNPPVQDVRSTPAVAINGVVRDKRLIGGVPYATISIGSADAVQKNMQFKVIDQDKNQFLGYLTVDSVEAHEATGRLDGPHVASVRPGVEVRTQL